MFGVAGAPTSPEMSGSSSRSIDCPVRPMVPQAQGQCRPGRGNRRDHRHRRPLPAKKPIADDGITGWQPFPEARYRQDDNFAQALGWPPMPAQPSYGGRMRRAKAQNFGRERKQGVQIEGSGETAAHRRRCRLSRFDPHAEPPYQHPAAVKLCRAGGWAIARLKISSSIPSKSSTQGVILGPRTVAAKFSPAAGQTRPSAGNKPIPALFRASPTRHAAGRAAFPAPAHGHRRMGIGLASVQTGSCAGGSGSQGVQTLHPLAINLPLRPPGHSAFGRQSRHFL